MPTVRKSPAPRAAKLAWQDTARAIANRVRRRVLEHTIKQNGGYLSQACSAAELFATLYTKIMHLGPSTGPLVPPSFAGVPGGGNAAYSRGGVYNGLRAPEYDQLIFSPAHYALVLYATLIETGRLDERALDHFNRDGSTVEMIGAEHSPGFETTTGSLAQALSVAGGIAMARKRRGEPGRVWVVMTDGEFQEGQTWEAFAALAHHGLGNVGVYADINGQQCDGPMTGVMGIEPLVEKLTAFGARAVRVDAHDVDALAKPATWKVGNKPLVVLAQSDPCRGIPLMKKRKPLLHYVRFKSKEEREAYQRVLDAWRD